MTSLENIECIAISFIKELSGINDNFREMYYIHSFAVEHENSFLWNTYINNHEGFCIEYDLTGRQEHLINILPILLRISRGMN